MAEFVKVEQDGRVAIVTLDHPPVNALSARLLEELEEEYDRLDRSDETRAIVLRGEGETDLPLAVSREVRTRAGRLVYNAYPTGVAVSWAQHHGGPWPSTNSQHTSVGTTAIRRFLRPVTWQGAPQDVLPEELTDGYRGIPRRVDGQLGLPR